MKTGTLVAIKERLNDDKLDLWDKEIELFKKIESRAPDLITSRMVTVLDDTDRKLPKKYIVMEWIEGKEIFI